MDTDITVLTNEQLSELIYRLSLESRRAYDSGFNGEAPVSSQEAISHED